MKKKVLVAGFGLMGCRHVQALLSENDNFEIHVLEPSLENIKTNTERIGAKENDCIWHSDIANIPFVDLAIVATSSGPRYTIVKSLLEKGIKYFLLEKIVFQSKYQFDDIIDLMKKKNATAWCNFVSRYFNAYKEIKAEIKNENNQIEMTVYGGAWGLGCNSVHYIDILQYLTNDNNVHVNNALIDVVGTENRRGKEYNEFTGTISVTNSKNDILNLIADKSYDVVGNTIMIKHLNTTYLLIDKAQKYYKISDGNIEEREYTVIPTSRLTNIIAADIFNNRCILTKIEETYNSHITLFEKFNFKLGFKKPYEDTLCPIT